MKKVYAVLTAYTFTFINGLVIIQTHHSPLTYFAQFTLPLFTSLELGPIMISKSPGSHT